MVLKAAIDAGMLWLAIVAIVFAIIGLYYYLRVIKVMYFDEPADDAPLALPQDLAFRWALSINGARAAGARRRVGSAARLVHARVRLPVSLASALASR